MTIMKSIQLLPLLAAIPLLLLAACGPSDSQLRAELREIDAEMAAIQIAAGQHRSQMGQAGVDAFVGSFAAGFGATSGDYGLAGEGVGAAADAVGRYDHSASSLEQLERRWITLGARRAEILAQLD